jgi:hypothetical protein
VGTPDLMDNPSELWFQRPIIIGTIAIGFLFLVRSAVTIVTRLRIRNDSIEEEVPLSQRDHSTTAAEKSKRKRLQRRQRIKDKKNQQKEELLLDGDNGVDNKDDNNINSNNEEPPLGLSSAPAVSSPAVVAATPSLSVHDAAVAQVLEHQRRRDWRRPSWATDEKYVIKPILHGQPAKITGEDHQDNDEKNNKDNDSNDHDDDDDNDNHDGGDERKEKKKEWVKVSKDRSKQRHAEALQIRNQIITKYAEQRQRDTQLQDVVDALNKKRHEWLHSYCESDIINTKMDQLCRTINDLTQSSITIPSSVSGESRKSKFQAISMVEWPKSAKVHGRIIPGHKIWNNNKVESNYKNTTFARQHLRYYFALNHSGLTASQVNGDHDTSQPGIISPIGSSAWSRCWCIWLVWSYASPRDICHVQVIPFIHHSFF